MAMEKQFAGVTDIERFLQESSKPTAMRYGKSEFPPSQGLALQTDYNGANMLPHYAEFVGSLCCVSI